MLLKRLMAFDDRYERLDRVSANCAKDANEFAKRLLDESEVEWPFICEDGDMMAIAHLFSDDLVSVAPVYYRTT